MNATLSRKAPWVRDNRATSLLVMVCVLAIVAIFAVVFLRAVFREMDHEVARQETASLRVFSDSLQRAIMRKGYITNATQWSDMVAMEMGASTSQVSTNARRQPRILLVDTNGWLQASMLPYTQTVAGSTNRPSGARVMLVSSLGLPLPFTSNFPDTNDFAALWNCQVDTLPTTGVWSGWGGRADDVKVERIMLDPLFVQLRLYTDPQYPQLGQYALGDPSPLYTAPKRQTNNPPRYVLRGSTLWLYGDAASGGHLDVHQIITKDSAFKYEDGIWKSVAAWTDLPGGVDLTSVAIGFLAATPNTNAMYGAGQQELILRSFLDFMRGYVTWATNGFPAGDKAALVTQQQYMLLKCQQLFTVAPYDSLPGNKDCVPINKGSCE